MTSFQVPFLVSFPLFFFFFRKLNHLGCLVTALDISDKVFCLGILGTIRELNILLSDFLQCTFKSQKI